MVVTALTNISSVLRLTRYLEAAQESVLGLDALRLGANLPLLTTDGSRSVEDTIRIIHALDA